MKQLLTTLALTAALVAGTSAQTPTQTPPAGSSATDLSKELQSLQGTWLVETINGQVAKDMGVEMLLVITGNKYQQVTNGTVDETGTIKLDASKKPLAIDLNIATGDSAGTVQLGIAEINGDTMQAVLAEPGSSMRPAGFSDSTAAIAVIVRRVK